MSSRSGTRASLPESTAEEKRVDDALRKHKLVSHEAIIFTDDPVHCFFRQDVKKWLRDNYKLLHRNGIIEDWLTEYPDIASRIEEAGLRGQSIKKVKNQEWQIFCNGYAINGFLPSGIHPRMGDNYTRIAVANIYIATVNLHIGLEAPVRFAHLIRMEHIAPLTWSNIVHQTGIIFDPRGRCRRLLRLLALLVRIWSSLRAGPRVWSALEERTRSHGEECRRFYSCMMDPRVS